MKLIYVKKYYLNYGVVTPVMQLIFFFSSWMNSMSHVKQRFEQKSLSHHASQARI